MQFAISSQKGLYFIQIEYTLSKSVCVCVCICVHGGEGIEF